MNRSKITYKDLEEVKKAFEKLPPKPPKIANSIDTWKLFREQKWSYAQWSDEELKNYDKETGLIGVKCGIECYVLFDDHFSFLSLKQYSRIVNK
jgi:hypothetical protein